MFSSLYCFRTHLSLNHVVSLFPHFSNKTKHIDDLFIFHLFHQRVNGDKRSCSSNTSAENNEQSFGLKVRWGRNQVERLLSDRSRMRKRGRLQEVVPHCVSFWNHGYYTVWVKSYSNGNFLKVAVRWRCSFAKDSQLCFECRTDSNGIFCKWSFRSLIYSITLLLSYFISTCTRGMRRVQMQTHIVKL